MSEALSAESQRALLRLARDAIAAHLGLRPQPPLPDSPDLAEPRGAFVSLHRRADRDLRGCVGFVEPLFPLVEAVARAAVTAATRDGRFAPVTADELPSLVIDVSVLGLASAIAPESVQVGTHGLIIRHLGLSGLLLPQVAVEQGWSREEFLDFTCRKAGLPSGTWRQPGVELLAFTAIVFRED